MRFDRLDLNLLVALDALIEHRSVSRTANQLYLSQPAMSGALNRLRDYFNDDILVASGRQMLLTPKAEELRTPVREALMLIRARITTPAHFDPATAERQFTIAASDYAFSVFASKVIARAAEIAPRITFEIIGTSLGTTERFERGEIDLLLSVPAYLSDAHPRMPLFEDEHAVICWSGSRHRAIDVDTFRGAGHVVVVFGNGRLPAVTERFFADEGFSRDIQVRVPSFSALPDAVIGTDRLATMWRRHAEAFARHLPITIHRPPIPMPRVVEEVQWHSLRENDEGLRWLLGLVREQAAAMTAPAADSSH